MAKIQQTETVTIDEVEYKVEELSNTVQQMIALMDEWRQKDSDLTSQLLMARAAIRDVQNTILNSMKADLAPATEETAEPTAKTAVVG